MTDLKSTAVSSDATASTSAKKSFKVVLIPADASLPCVEESIEFDDETLVSCLFDHCKKHFASVSSLTSNDETKSAVRQQIVSMMKQQQNSSSAVSSADINDEMISRVMSMSAVDTVPLQNNKESTRFVALNLYVDDQGVVKKLPLNVRASGIATLCGQAIQIIGDSFIARCFDDNKDDFRRLDFSLEEMNKSSAWIESAKAAARESAASSGKAEEMREWMKQMAPNAVQLNSGNQSSKASDPSTSIKSSTPATVGSARHVCSEGFSSTCKSLGTLRCSRCRDVYYCSNDCQKADWSRHKSTCNAMAKRIKQQTAENRAKAETAVAK